ncbi:hypothetical protein GCM10022226_71640 [Sphaerisporangium flaviroseum]|uniref:Uncharacterized protein n=1 Tax=Sphaerisporangium flaviroseum TaxID=509199 RepID=A0ABP7J9Z9_9ACTN
MSRKYDEDRRKRRGPSGPGGTARAEGEDRFQVEAKASPSTEAKASPSTKARRISRRRQEGAQVRLEVWEQPQVSGSVTGMA